MSDHLDMLAGQIFDVEEELGTLLVSADPQSAISITRFQSLDFTRQSLEDCALLLSLLSREDVLEKSIHEEKLVAQKLKLDATRALLSRNTTERRSSNLGDVDLF